MRYLSLTSALEDLIDGGMLREKPAFSNPNGELDTSQYGVVDEDGDGAGGKGPDASYCREESDEDASVSAAVD